MCFVVACLCQFYLVLRLHRCQNFNTFFLHAYLLVCLFVFVPNFECVLLLRVFGSFILFWDCIGARTLIHFSCMRICLCVCAKFWMCFVVACVWQFYLVLRLHRCQRGKLHWGKELNWHPPQNTELANAIVLNILRFLRYKYNYKIRYKYKQRHKFREVQLTPT